MRVSVRRLPDGGLVAVFSDLTALRRLAAVRTQFVANASHELKTPLTAIRGYAETLLDPEVPQDHRVDFARRIDEHANRMTSIVEDLLTLARLEEPGRAAGREPIAARPLLEEIRDTLADRAGAAGLDVTLQVEPPDLEIVGDREGLRQIVENLLDNAIRHSSAGNVELRAVRSSPDAARISVRDDGCGIPSAHLDRIFERFYRVDPGRSRATGGTGLGLSIVKHWAENMGGRVRVESSVGEGTEVHVALPAGGDQDAGSD